MRNTLNDICESWEYCLAYRMLDKSIDMIMGMTILCLWHTGCWWLRETLMEIVLHFNNELFHLSPNSCQRLRTADCGNKGLIPQFRTTYKGTSSSWTLPSIGRSLMHRNCRLASPSLSCFPLENSSESFSLSILIKLSIRVYFSGIQAKVTDRDKSVSSQYLELLLGSKFEGIKS